VPCTSPAPTPTSHLGASDPALVSQLLAQGYSPRNNTLLWSLNFSFKTFCAFRLDIIFSLQILTLVVPYGTVIGWYALSMPFFNFTNDLFLC
jgi:hypothetical protein